MCFNWKHFVSSTWISWMLHASVTIVRHLCQGHGDVSFLAYMSWLRIAVVCKCVCALWSSSTGVIVSEKLYLKTTPELCMMGQI